MSLANRLLAEEGSHFFTQPNIPPTPPGPADKGRSTFGDLLDQAGVPFTQRGNYSLKLTDRTTLRLTSRAVRVFRDGSSWVDLAGGNHAACVEAIKAMLDAGIL